jgi:hypothetical protein
MVYAYKLLTSQRQLSSLLLSYIQPLISKEWEDFRELVYINILACKETETSARHAPDVNPWKINVHSSL